MHTIKAAGRWIWTFLFGDPAALFPLNAEDPLYTVEVTSYYAVHAQDALTAGRVYAKRGLLIDQDLPVVTVED